MVESNLPSQWQSVFHFHFSFITFFFSLGCIPFQITAVVENAVSGHPYHGECVFMCAVCVCDVKRVNVEGRVPKLLFDYFCDNPHTRRRSKSD
jgi:hypothetical protein